MKRFFHILITVFLVVSTTGSIWVQLLKNIDDPIELTTSEASVEGEKESKKELDSWDNDLFAKAFELAYDLHCGWLKEGSSSYQSEGSVSTKLYLKFQQLRLDC